VSRYGPSQFGCCLADAALRWTGEVFRVLVPQQFGGKPLPFVLDHHLAGVAMGEGIQASEKRDPTIDDNNFLVHVGVGHCTRHDRAKFP
jgi:hypothetical protein